MVGFKILKSCLNYPIGPLRWLSHIFTRLSRYHSIHSPGSSIDCLVDIDDEQEAALYRLVLVDLFIFLVVSFSTHTSG